MSDSPSQLDHLKSLVSQLQAKIERLEKQASSTAGEVKGAVESAAGSVKEALLPSHHLRMVLMGPPGAGELFASF
jgi:adenylate kinase